MGVGPVIINAISTLHLIFQAWQRNQLLMNFLEVTMTPLLRIDKVNVHLYCDVINDYWNINSMGLKENHWNHSSNYAMRSMIWKI